MLTLKPGYPLLRFEYEKLSEMPYGREDYLKISDSFDFLLGFKSNQKSIENHRLRASKYCTRAGGWMVGCRWQH